MFDDSKWNMKLRNKIYVLPFAQIIKGIQLQSKTVKNQLWARWTMAEEKTFKELNNQSKSALS